MSGPCARCGGALVGEEGYVKWCPACDWNAAPPVVAPDSSKPSRLDRFEVSMAQRVHDDVIARGAHRPRPSAAGVVLVAFCAFVVLSHVFLVVLAVWLMVVSSAWGWTLVFALPLAAAGIYPFVAILRRRRGVVSCRRSDFPALYQLVDDVAAASGSPTVRTIELSPGLNASSSRGLRGRRLTIGLSLWAALRPDERLAVIGHELGHFRNGDFRRSWLVAVAVGALHEWHAAMSIPRRGLAALMVAVVALPVQLALVVTTRLGFVTGQRAEYFADAVASRIASTDAMVRALAALRGSAATVELASQKNGITPDFWEQLAARFAALPSTEVQRRVRAAELDVEVQPGSTHPPCGLRIRVLRAHPVEGDPMMLQRPYGEDPGWVTARQELARYLVRGR